jgi:hypothetical protein
VADRVFDQRGPDRDFGHLETRLGQLGIGRIIAAKLAAGLFVPSRATPKAFATQPAVMSSWVGPMPPVVKT